MHFPSKWPKELPPQHHKANNVEHTDGHRQTDRHTDGLQGLFLALITSGQIDRISTINAKTSTKLMSGETHAIKSQVQVRLTVDITSHFMFQGNWKK